MDLQRHNPFEIALAELEARADAFVDGSWSPNTLRAYRGAWNRYLEWCAAFRLNPMPSPEAQVRAYLAALADDDKGWSTINTALTAISQGHALAGADFNRQDPLLVRTMKGIRRSLAERGVDRAAPLLPDQIAAACELLPDTPRGTRDRAVLCVGFAGGFRRSELVGLQLRDLEFDEKERGVLVLLRTSKTDQFGAGRYVAVPFSSRRATCPVRNLNAWFEVAEAAGMDLETPVFRSVSGRDGATIDETPMSDKAVGRLVKRAAALAGVDDTSNYSAHSLRAGFVTAAAEAGKAEHTIMAQTGHKSADTLRRYIRQTDIWRENPAEGLL